MPTLIFDVLIILYCTSNASVPARTADSLRAEIASTVSKINSISVRYEVIQPDVPGEPIGQFTYREIAAKRPSSYFRINAHGHNSLPWQDDLWRADAYLQADKLYVHSPVTGYVHIVSCTATEPMSGSLARDPFHLATGIYPNWSRAAVRGGTIPIPLRDIAEDIHFSIVRPGLEVVDGVECHILEHCEQRHVLWLDTDNGCVVKRRDYFDPESGSLLERYEPRSHFAVADGVYMPREILLTRYPRGAVDTLKPQAVSQALIHILESNINCVDDSRFDFRPPSGCIITEVGNDAPPVVIAGGFEHLDFTVDWAKRHTTRQNSTKPPSTTWFKVVCGFVALVIIMETVVFAIRWRFRRAHL